MSQFRSLLIGVALLTIGNGLLATVVGVRAGVEGMAEETIGIVMSAYYVGFVTGSAFAPRLIQAVGHIRTFAALASIASVASLLLIMFVWPATWTALRYVSGVCFAGLVIIAESWLNAGTERSQRGRVLATYGIVVYAGWALSQLLLSVSPPAGFLLFSLAAVCLSLALVPITLSRVGVPGVVAASRSSMARLYVISPFGFIGAFLLGVAVSALFGMGPTFAQSIGLDEGDTAAFLGCALMGALAIQWPVGWLSDRTDRRHVIIIMSLAAAVASAGLAFSAQADTSLRLVLSFLLGGALLPLYSVCVAHINDKVEANEVIPAASGLLMAYGVGSAFGPISAGLLMGRIGPPGLFLLISGSALAVVLYGLIRVVSRRRVAGERKQSYVAVPQTSHAVLPLHKHGSGEATGATAPR